MVDSLVYSQYTLQKRWRLFVTTNNPPNPSHETEAINQRLQALEEEKSQLLSRKQRLNQQRLTSLPPHLR